MNIPSEIHEPLNETDESEFEKSDEEEFETPEPENSKYSVLLQQYKTKTSFTLRKICATARFKSSLIEVQRREIFENSTALSVMASQDLSDSLDSIQEFYKKLSRFFVKKPVEKEESNPKMRTINQIIRNPKKECGHDDQDICIFETNFLRFSSLLSDEMLNALEHEMSAMFSVISITDEKASTYSCKETQNNILISMAKWYKESNMLDVFKLCLKAIEYFLTYSYIKDPDLKNVPISKVRSHADLQESLTEFPENFQFVGKTGQNATNALAHMVSVHISLQTCVELIKNTIDSKIMRCDCISLNGPCHCQPSDFLEAKDTNLGADILEGNCLSSYH